jgi:acyl-CoA hydrolase
VGGATGEPRTLVENLIAQRHALGPISVFLGPSFTGLFRPEHTDVFRFRSIGGVGTTATLTRAGLVDVLPIHLGTIPGLISTRRMAVDVVLVQLSPPDDDGRHTLGLVADYLQAAISAARVTLAEVNPRVPRTRGDTAVFATQISAVVPDDRTRCWPSCGVTAISASTPDS